MAVSKENIHFNTCLKSRVGEVGGISKFSPWFQRRFQTTEKSANWSEQVSNLGPSECKSSMILWNLLVSWRNYFHTPFQYTLYNPLKQQSITSTSYSPLRILLTADEEVVPLAWLPWLPDTDDEPLFP